MPYLIDFGTAAADLSCFLILSLRPSSLLEKGFATKERLFADRLRVQAASDPLTGLGNYRRLVAGLWKEAFVLRMPIANAQGERNVQMLTKSVQVLTKTMKWASIGTLLWAFLYRSSASDPRWSVTEGGYLE